MERKWRLVSCHRAVRQARIIHGSRTGEAVTCEETRNPVHPALQILYLSRFLSESASRCPPLQAAAFHARVDSPVPKRPGASVQHLNDYLFHSLSKIPRMIVALDSSLLQRPHFFFGVARRIVFRCCSREARSRFDLHSRSTAGVCFGEQRLSGHLENRATNSGQPTLRHRLSPNHQRSVR
jgi:hypothetical protein